MYRALAPRVGKKSFGRFRHSNLNLIDQSFSGRPSDVDESALLVENKAKISAEDFAKCLKIDTCYTTYSMVKDSSRDNK